MLVVLHIVALDKEAEAKDNAAPLTLVQAVAVPAVHPMIVQAKEAEARVNAVHLILVLVAAVLVVQPMIVQVVDELCR